MFLQLTIWIWTIFVEIIFDKNISYTNSEIKIFLITNRLLFYNSYYSQWNLKTLLQLRIASAIYACVLNILLAP